MLEKYDKFNESRRNKGRRSSPVNTHRQRIANAASVTNRVVEPRGMPLDLSTRFKYIITIIADKGNAIAKDMLKNLNNPNVKFEYSYLDLTGRADTISYLPNGERNLPEEERYKSNKRQHSKVYKVVKTIFGSKYTKTDVGKFVSMFKQVFETGKSNNKESVRVSGIDKKQLLEKLTQDTKNDKIKWIRSVNSQTYNKFEFKIKATEKKSFVFHFYYYFNYSNNSMITLSMYTDNSYLTGIDRGGKVEWILTIPFPDVKEFSELFKEKYLKEES